MLFSKKEFNLNSSNKVYDAIKNLCDALEKGQSTFALDFTNKPRKLFCTNINDIWYTLKIDFFLKILFGGAGNTPTGNTNS